MKRQPISSHKRPNPHAATFHRPTRRLKINKNFDCMEDSHVDTPSGGYAIGNDTYQRPPTAYSPHKRLDDDPFRCQQQQCRSKLQALRNVRARLTFSDSKVVPCTIFSAHLNNYDPTDVLSRENASDKIAGLEHLVFQFLRFDEMMHFASPVCRLWRVAACSDIQWEAHLYTPHEKYPLRKLLGMEDMSVPAIQVYMVFRHMRLAQRPPGLIDQRGPTRDRTEVPPSLSMQWMAGKSVRTHPRESKAQWGLVPLDGYDDNVVGRSALVASVHLVTKVKDFAFARSKELRMEDDKDPGLETKPSTYIPEDVSTAMVDVFERDLTKRMTMNNWRMHQPQVLPERLVQSVLRQLLLGVSALERSYAVHLDISLDTILVVDSVVNNVVATEQTSSEESDVTSLDSSTPVIDVTDNDALVEEKIPVVSYSDPFPLVQLFCDLSTVMNRRPESLVTQGEGILPPQTEDGREGLGLHQEMEHARQNMRGRRGMNQHRRDDDPTSMIYQVVYVILMLYTSFLRPAKKLSATSTLEALRYTNLPSDDLRGFLEYAIILAKTHEGYYGARKFGVARRLLLHAYLNDVDLRVVDGLASGSIMVTDRKHTPCLPRGHASSSIQMQTYVEMVEAWHLSSSNHIVYKHTHRHRSDVERAMMPSTALGRAYLDTVTLPRRMPLERFVALTVPWTDSSTVIEDVVKTQFGTLQQLDLSRVYVPFSVMLQQLEKLRNLRRVRLPRELLREDNLEQMIAALDSRGVLEKLQVMDEEVARAMDRMEESYKEQLDMLQFILETKWKDK